MCEPTFYDSVQFLKIQIYTLYEYTTPTFLGTRNFVAMIDTTTADSKEVWLKTETGKLQIK